MFLAIDENHSGTITVDEFMKALEAKGQSINMAAAKQIIEVCGRGGGGTGADSRAVVAWQPSKLVTGVLRMCCVAFLESSSSRARLIAGSVCMTDESPYGSFATKEKAIV
jgi:hypothetical protein